MKLIDKYTNKIICANCIDIMQDMPDNSVDLILTDPPYGVLQDTSETWDSNDIDWNNWFSCVDRILKCNGYIFVFGMTSFYCKLYQYFRDKFRIHFDIVWVKPNVVNFPQAKNKPMNKHELILCLVKNSYKAMQATYNYELIGDEGSPIKRKGGYLSGKINARMVYKTNYSSNGYRYPSTVWNSYSRNTMPFNERTDHPTQKPLPLLQKLILGFSNEKDVILDPFLGSGSTAVAAKSLNRHYVGIEMDQKYCDITNERLKQEYLF